MAATNSDLSRWLVDGKVRGATHVLVVHDTYDVGDYPVFVMPGEDARERAAEIDEEPMQRVIEVYNLAMDLDAQLDPRTRVWNYGAPNERRPTIKHEMG